MVRAKERDIQRKIALRSRRKLKNRDSSVRDSNLDEARDMLRTLTRLRNRALLDGGDGRSNQKQQEGKENVQPKKRRKRHKEVDLSSRRLTRSMDGETLQNSTEGSGRKIPTRLSLFKAKSVEGSGSSEFLSEDVRKRKRIKKEDMFGKRAGMRLGIAASANRRGLAMNNRGARLKMARRSLRSAYSFRSSRSFSSSRGRSGKNAHHVPTKQGLMKDKERQASLTGLEPSNIEGVQHPTIQVNRDRRRKGHEFQECRSRKRIACITDGASASLNAEDFQSTENGGITRQLATTESPTTVIPSANQTGPRKRKRKRPLESRDAKGPMTRGRMYRDLHDLGQKDKEEHIGKADNASDGEGAGTNLCGPSTGKSNREHKQKKRSGNVELVPILTRSKRKVESNGLHNGEAGQDTGHQEKDLLLHEIRSAKNENDADASRVRRKSKRKNTADGSGAGDQEIAQEIHVPKSTKGTEATSVQDDPHKPVLKGGHATVPVMRCTEGNLEAECLASAPKLALGHDGAASRDEACKVDLIRNCCLVATVPKEIGGRQMRPRPLDLEQPMPIVIEGYDQGDEDNDGGSFDLSLQEPKDMEKEHRVVKASSWGTSQDLAAVGGKGKPIVIPSFRVVSEYEQEESSRPVYTMPKSYIKASTWAAKDHKHQAEYDVDGEDVDWINNHNKTSHPGRLLSLDRFEKIIDLLENKAADLDKLNLLSTDFGQDNESEDCCICNGGENSSNNLLFRCAMCHINVHQSCYGIQVSGVHAQDRKWYCRKCEAVAEGTIDSEVRCALCCKQGGALKPATEPQQWVHVVCALYTNETFFVNPDAMEPIDGVSAADARAKKQRRRCWLCGMKEGSSERCSVPTCRAVFHVSCGVRQGASFEVQHFNQQIVYVRPFCPKHATTAPVSSALVQESTSIDETSIEDSRKNVMRRKGRRKSLRRRRAARKGASILENVTKGRASAEDRASNEADEKGTGISGGTEPPLPNGISNTKLNLSEKVLQKSIDEPYAILSLEDLPETNMASRDLVQEVYWYWLSKREKFGGPLLHHIQQELAAEYFGIFNPSGGDGDATSSMFHGRGFRHSFSMKQKLLAMRLQLQRLHELNDLVIKRERLKLDLYILNQDIAKLGLKALVGRDKDNVGPRGRRCFVCKEAYRLVQCALCSKGFCFRCFKSMTGAGMHNWLTTLKLPEFACSECQKEKYEATEKPPPDSGDDCINCEDDPLHHVDHTDGGHSNGCITRGTFVKEDEGLENDVENGASPSSKVSERQVNIVASDLENGASPSTEVSERKVNILLPHSGLQQDKAATQAFWESFEQQSNPKTVLVSQLLKNMFHKLREDVPKKLAKIHRRT